MKVAMISHEGGGISSVTTGLARSLARKGVDVTIFTGVTRPPFLQTEKIDDHLEVVHFQIPDFPPRNLWFQVLNFNKLSTVLGHYDLIHGVSPYASFGLTFFKKKIGKPFVMTIHDSHRQSQKAFFNQPVSTWTLSDVGYYFLEFPLYDYSVRRAISSSDFAAFCSYALLAELAAYRNLNYRRVKVIHNGVDFDEIESTKDCVADTRNEITIIYGGRLYWVKGVMLLLETFNRLRKDYGNVHLKIFGKGPLRQKIEEYIGRFGLRDRVSCMGHVPHRKLLAEIKKANIVAFPSLCEAQPMFILEAMACRKPVVAFDLPFAREIISNMRSGLLAKKADVEDLSNKIGTLVSDEKLQRNIGQAAYNYVKTEHNWDVQVGKYLQVYESLMNQE